MKRYWLLATVSVLLAGCGQGAAPSGGSGQEARARGELLSLACRACHTLGQGEDHQIGPNLYGVFGRAAGKTEGFAYSPALGAATFVWTPAELDAWLADPAGYLPGTTMSFTGYQSADDRAALIDYLVEATGGDTR